MRNITVSEVKYRHRPTSNIFLDNIYVHVIYVIDVIDVIFICVQTIPIRMRLQQIHVMQWGWGGSNFPGLKGYDGVLFYAISVTRGWVCVNFPEKNRSVALEWPQ